MLIRIRANLLARHSKVYTDLIPIMEDVFTKYTEEVKSHVYPGPEHTVYMKPEELKEFAKAVNWESKLSEIG